MVLRKKIPNSWGTPEHQSTCEAMAISRSRPAAQVTWQLMVRPEDSVAFEIRPQRFALQAPLGRMAGMSPSWKPRVKIGVVFPVVFLWSSTYHVNVRVKKSWSFPRPCFPLFPLRNPGRSGSQGRKKAQESVGKDEDWVHSGHRLNLPLEAWPWLEMEMGCSKSKGPGSLDQWKSFLDGSSLYLVYVSVVHQFNSPTVHYPQTRRTFCFIGKVD